MNRPIASLLSGALLAFGVRVHGEYHGAFGQRTPAPVATPSPAKGIVAINDIQIHYETHGDGPPLILLHGGLGNAGYWEKQIPALSKKYKVIAMDCRGHGRSTFSEQPIGFAPMASDVVPAT